MSLLDIFELIHSSGIVYNDLKPDNITVNYGETISYFNDNEFESSFNRMKFNLIDFGLATKWVD